MLFPRGSNAFHFSQTKVAKYSTLVTPFHFIYGLARTIVDRSINAVAKSSPALPEKAHPANRVNANATIETLTRHTNTFRSYRLSCSTRTRTEPNTRRVEKQVDEEGKPAKERLNAGELSQIVNDEDDDEKKKVEKKEKMCQGNR